MFTDWDLAYSGNDNVGHECTFLLQKYPFNLRSLTQTIRPGRGEASLHRNLATHAGVGGVVDLGPAGDVVLGLQGLVTAFK